MKKRGKLGYVKEILRSYPEIKAKPEKERTRNEQRRVRIVEHFLQTVEHMPDAGDKRKLIDMVYFQQSHTLWGAAMQIPVCERLAQKWNAEFMRAIFELMDLM